MRVSSQFTFLLFFRVFPQGNKFSSPFSSFVSFLVASSGSRPLDTLNVLGLPSYQNREMITSLMLSIVYLVKKFNYYKKLLDIMVIIYIIVTVA